MRPEQEFSLQTKIFRPQPLEANFPWQLNRQQQSRLDVFILRSKQNLDYLNLHVQHMPYSTVRACTTKERDS